MKTGAIVKKLHLGNSVAEFDKELEKYFVETEPFRALVEDRADVIAGDKGTGKTALYSILRKRYGVIDYLGKVEVVAAFNPSGNPVFSVWLSRKFSRKRSTLRYGRPMCFLW